MIEAQVIRSVDMAVQPWRNGGGLMRELLAWPSADDWLLRLSVADIGASGPFSSFAGVQRWFAVIEGAGVAVTIAGHQHTLRPGDAPLCFDGAAKASCRLLAGPTRDLNLMLRGAQGAMLLAASGQVWQPGAPMCGLFAAQAGRCTADQQVFDLPAQALLWFQEAPDALRFVCPNPGPGPVGWWLWARPAPPAEPRAKTRRLRPRMSGTQ